MNATPGSGNVDAFAETSGVAEQTAFFAPHMAKTVEPS
jgi:hypothetical protein